MLKPSINYASSPVVGWVKERQRCRPIKRRRLIRLVESREPEISYSGIWDLGSMLTMMGQREQGSLDPSYIAT